MELVKNEVEVVAEKVLAKICDKIKNQIGDEFYREYSNYLYEHYVNHKEKIDEKLIQEIEDRFVIDPKLYKFLGLRKRLYEENKTEIDKAVTKDVIEEGIKNILGIYTSSDFYFNWKWKDGIIRVILANWDKFRDDERIKAGFGNALEQKQAKIEELEKQIREIKLALEK